MFACCSNLSSSSISRKELGNEKVFFIKMHKSTSTILGLTVENLLYPFRGVYIGTLGI